MEFLLINHPLDCPICDQGGECELQDLAVGFGRDISRFVERKRVVKDKNLGPLVSTDMTRCIHCTRCVRFGQDIAGIQEMGATGRGEHMEIGTYIERSVDHELSGNIIDLCPVGALNSKPFRYRGRGWEMTQYPLISPHDGTALRSTATCCADDLMRVVPRPCEEINETWIADRDRYSYEGVYSEDRLLAPQVRQADGSWKRSRVGRRAGGRCGRPEIRGTAMRAGQCGIAGASVEHAGRAVSAGALADGLGSARTSIIVCVSGISAIRPAIRWPQAWDWRLRTSTGSMRCW
jgi:NADH dehydrogenase/NADH:ubiquinone oxidoreductase subunit G